jgi:predicted transcriptional regulator
MKKSVLSIEAVLFNMKKEEIQIGELICSRLKDEGRTKTWLAEKVNCEISSLCKILKKSHIDTELLLQISRKMNYDFFTHFAALIHEKGDNKDL